MHVFVTHHKYHPYQIRTRPINPLKYNIYTINTRII